jgi:HSP20 family protein
MATNQTLEQRQDGNVRTDGQPQETAQTRGTEGVYSPRVDIVETNDAFCMYAFMPGVKPDDVSLHCKDGQLVLHGRCSARSAGKRLLHQEYGVGDFYRTFTLTNLVDQSKIDAKLENGVLAITLPKTESAKPRRIAVKGN